MQVATVVVQGFAMVSLPLGAVVLARRRWPGVGVGPALVGAVAFVASQVVHVPLNLGVTTLAGRGWLPLLPAALVPVAYGLSAGLCEETARWVSLRRRRTVAEAVVTGIGHGGIEAAGLGGLVLLTAVQLAALGSLVEVPPAAEQALSDFRAASDTYALAAVVERLSAMTAHAAMSVWVGLAVARRAPWPWAVAVLLHTAFDAGAVALLPRGVWVVEAFCVGFAAVTAGSAWLAVRWWPLPPAPVVSPVPAPSLAARPLDPRDADYGDPT